MLSVGLLISVGLNFKYTDKIKELEKNNCCLQARNEILNQDLKENIEILERIKDNLQF